MRIYGAETREHSQSAMSTSSVLWSPEQCRAVILADWTEPLQRRAALRRLLGGTGEDPFPLTLEEIQREVGEWAGKQFGDNPSRAVGHPSEGHPLGSIPALLGMGEEVGELNHAVVYRLQGRGDFHKDEVFTHAKEDGMGDLAVFGCDFANREKVNWTQALNKTWAKVRNRIREKWNECKAQEAGPERAALEGNGINHAIAEAVGGPIEPVPPLKDVIHTARPLAVPPIVQMLVLKTMPEVTTRESRGVIDIIASGRVRCKVREDGNIVFNASATPLFLNVAGAEELAACLVQAAIMADGDQCADTQIFNQEHRRSVAFQEAQEAEQNGHGWAEPPLADGI
jgi:hypothetical protein